MKNLVAQLKEDHVFKPFTPHVKKGEENPDAGFFIRKKGEAAKFSPLALSPLF